MNTHDKIELPTLPEPFTYTRPGKSEGALFHAGHMQDYALAAIEADRQSRNCGQCVPLSADGTAVFIDGVGEVPLDFSGQARRDLISAYQAKVRALEAENYSLVSDLDEQQCSDFWAWIRRAYRDSESAAYTVHNMEVAYQAGRASVKADRQARGGPVGSLSRSADESIKFTPFVDLHVTDGMLVYTDHQPQQQANENTTLRIAGCICRHLNVALDQSSVMAAATEIAGFTTPRPAEPVKTDSAGYTLGPISDGVMDPRNANDRQARGGPVALEYLRTHSHSIRGAFEALKGYTSLDEEDDPTYYDHEIRALDEALAVIEAPQPDAVRPVVGEPVAIRPVDYTPPYDNCRFRLCDLPGQCRGEGKCHHPARPDANPAIKESLTVDPLKYGSPDSDDYVTGWNDAIRAFGFKQREAG